VCNDGPVATGSLPLSIFANPPNLEYRDGWGTRNGRMAAAAEPHWPAGPADGPISTQRHLATFYNRVNSDAGAGDDFSFQLPPNEVSLRDPSAGEGFIVSESSVPVRMHVAARTPAERKADRWAARDRPSARRMGGLVELLGFGSLVCK